MSVKITMTSQPIAVKWAGQVVSEHVHFHKDLLKGFLLRKNIHIDSIEKCQQEPFSLFVSKMCFHLKKFVYTVSKRPHVCGPNDITCRLCCEYFNSLRPSTPTLLGCACLCELNLVLFKPTASGKYIIS